MLLQQGPPVGVEFVYLSGHPADTTHRNQRVVTLFPALIEERL